MNSKKMIQIKKILKYIQTYWFLISFCFTLLSIILYMIIFQVSPWDKYHKIKNNREQERFHCRISYDLLEKGYYKDAKLEFEKALTINSNNYMALNGQYQRSLGMKKVSVFIYLFIFFHLFFVYSQEGFDYKLENNTFSFQDFTLSFDENIRPSINNNSPTHLFLESRFILYIFVKKIPQSSSSEKAAILHKLNKKVMFARYDDETIKTLRKHQSHRFIKLKKKIIGELHWDFSPYAIFTKHAYVFIDDYFIEIKLDYHDCGYTIAKNSSLIIEATTPSDYEDFLENFPAQCPIFDLPFYYWNDDIGTIFDKVENKSEDVPEKLISLNFHLHDIIKSITYKKHRIAIVK